MKTQRFNRAYYPLREGDGEGPQVCAHVHHDVAWAEQRLHFVGLQDVHAPELFDPVPDVGVVERQYERVVPPPGEHVGSDTGMQLAGHRPGALRIVVLRLGSGLPAQLPLNVFRDLRNRIPEVGHQRNRVVLPENIDVLFILEGAIRIIGVGGRVQ